MSTITLRGDGKTRLFYLPQSASSIDSVAAPDGTPRSDFRLDNSTAVIFTDAPALGSVWTITFTPGVQATPSGQPPVTIAPGQVVGLDPAAANKVTLSAGQEVKVTDGLQVVVTSMPPADPVTVSFPAVQDVRVTQPVDLSAGATVGVSSLPDVTLAVGQSLKVEPGAAPLHVIVDNQVAGGGGGTASTVGIDPAQNTVVLAAGAHVSVDAMPALALAAGQSVKVEPGSAAIHTAVDSLPAVSLAAGQSLKVEPGSAAIHTAVDSLPAVAIAAGQSVKVEPGTSPVHVVVDSMPAGSGGSSGTPVSGGPAVTLFNGTYGGTGTFYTAEMDTGGAIGALLYLTSTGGATITHYLQYKDPVTASWNDHPAAVTFQVLSTTPAKVFPIGPTFANSSGASMATYLPRTIRFRVVVNSGTTPISSCAVAPYYA